MAPSIFFQGPSLSDRTNLQHLSRSHDTILPAKDLNLPYGSLAWSGAQYNGDREYTYVLSEEEKVEIETALEYFKRLELDGQEVSQISFPLPTLRHKLSAFAEDLHSGKGFIVLRGLEPSKHPIEENIILFWDCQAILENEGECKTTMETCLVSYGQLCSCWNRLTMYLVHLREAKEMATSQVDRPARDSNMGLQFHADLWADILAMQVLSNAAKGGDHLIAPAYTIYNELSITRPDLLELLMKPVWTFDPLSLHYNPEKRPLIFSYGGKILFNFGRLHVFGDQDSQRPALSTKQIEALELLQTLAQKHQLRLRGQPGDLTFVNNFAIVHSRDAFEDSKLQSRHFIRLWLKNEDLAWKLPPVLDRGNKLVFYNNSIEETWEIMPRPRLNFEIRDKFGP